MKDDKHIEDNDSIASKIIIGVLIGAGILLVSIALMEEYNVSFNDVFLKVLPKLVFQFAKAIF